MAEDPKKQTEGSNIDPKVKEVHDLVKEYKDSDARIKAMDRREKCWDAIENEMFTDDEKKQIRGAGQDEEFVINDLVKGVQGSSAIVTDQKPELKMNPVGTGDLYVAELVKRGVDFVWGKNEGNDVTYEVVEEAKVGGMGFFDVKHDPNLGIFGRVVFEETPPDDIYFDADSRRRDLSDTHIIKAKYRTKSYIKDHYPDLSEEDMIYDPEIKGDAKSSGVTGEDNYVKGAETDKPDSGEDRKEPKNILEAEAWLLKTRKEDWLITMGEGAGAEPTSAPIELTPKEKKAAEPGEKLRDGIYWPRTMTKRVQRIVVGQKMIEEHENPYGEDRDGNPIVRLIALKHQKTRTAYAMSPTFYALPINRDKNKRRMQFALAISHNVNTVIVEPAGQVKWEGTPGTPGSRVKVDANAAFEPHRMAGGTADTTRFLELESIDSDDIYNIYDMQDVMRGKMPKGTDPSGRAVLALQDRGGMMSKPFLRSLEASLVRFGKVIVALMLKHWPRYMWENLVEDDEMKRWTPQGVLQWKEPHGPDEEEAEQMEEIHNKWMDAIERVRPQDPEKKGITLIDLDVKMTAGSSLASNRVGKMSVAIDLKKEEIYDAEAALKYIDDPEKDNIIRRLKEREEKMAEMEMTKLAK